MLGLFTLDALCVIVRKGGTGYVNGCAHEVIGDSAVAL